MSTDDTRFAWWSRLRHSGLLLSPVVQIEKYAEPPWIPKWYQPEKLRTAYNRFLASIDRSKDRPQLAQGDILTWVDALLERYIGHEDQRFSRSHSIPESLTAVIRIGSRTETLRPDRVLLAEDGKTPLLLVKADESPHIGRGKGRTEYARFLELLRGCGHRIGLLTNGLQFRLVYAGLDFESWCEWESERWFEDAEGTEELLGLRQILFPTQISDNKGEVTSAGLPGLLTAIEESRKRQADLSQVLRENVRQAVELLLEDVSNASRTDADLFHHLVSPASSNKHLTDSEAQEALLQATVRVVMRMVVCLFAESRGLLPVNDLIYSQAYGVRTLYELLDETVRHEGSQLGLMSRQSAWARLMALFRLIHGGSSHGGFPLRPYGGALFRPGKADDDDPVLRALFILEHKVNVNDATLYRVLRKLLRGPLPVLRGRSKTYVEGPVDYTELRTEFIGLIYEGLLDYRVKRTTEEIGPQVFLKLGRQPVLPLFRLEAMLEDDPNSLKDLFTILKKEAVAATVESDEESQGDSDEDSPESEESEIPTEELSIEVEEEEKVADRTYLDAVQAARRWARQAIIATKLIGQQRAREADTEYDQRIEVAIDELIDRVVSPGEFYLVRAGNTRKGTGTFYTRPQLAVPTVHRTLEPLCFDKDEKEVLTPKSPDEILGIKVCDPACGSASFLVAALHYLTHALYKSLCFHCGLDDPKRATKITLPFGKLATGKDSDATVPLPPDDSNRGEDFVERVQALLRRHVVERCIYGVDINPLAVEFARVSLWVETLDRDLPFSFLDHKIKVGNALVGCWLKNVEDYPVKAWERQAGDGPNGDSSQRIEELLKGPTVGSRRTGDGRIKQEMRQLIKSHFSCQPALFPEGSNTKEKAVTEAREQYEALHDLPVANPEERERYYRERIQQSLAVRTLRSAMNEWCSVWFWPSDEKSLRHAPTPLTFHSSLPEKDEIVSRLANTVCFFHWEIEFPDVFSTQRLGFDAIVGNPPWETVQQQSIEFFSDFDPLYRSYGKQKALKQQLHLFESVPAILRSWEEYCEHLAALNHWFKAVHDPFSVSLENGRSQPLLRDWEKARFKRATLTDVALPFRLQGSGKTYSYRAFLETSWHLLGVSGRLGMIVPTGFYYDKGGTDIRREMINRGTLEFLYAFQNEKRFFVGVDHSFKQAALVASKVFEEKPLTVIFRMGLHHSPSAHEIPDDFLKPTKHQLVFSREQLRIISPETLSLTELGSSRELEVFEKIYRNSFRIGEGTPACTFRYAQDFNMTSDSRQFSTLSKADSLGLRSDCFGTWRSDNGKVAIPLYEGSMIHQFDSCYQSWDSGQGAGSLWSSNPPDAKRILPRYVVPSENLVSKQAILEQVRVAYRTVARNHARRTMLASPLVGSPCGNSISTLLVEPRNVLTPLAVVACLNSYCFDFIVRIRNTGLNQNWFIIRECPLPLRIVATSHLERLALSSARLSWCHRRFAPQWLTLMSALPDIQATEWKQLWAVRAEDRTRLRVETDALVAELYGISCDEMDWIIRDDRTEPRSFYRVDSELPFEERLTGLSARAFRGLKEGKWSAETVGQLSNDEFFDLLGIPELTNAEAAKAKGLSGPLILKRDGCHSWHPENFPEDDPRHGWTWDDCRKDAITLLGSEESLEQYIAEATASGNEGDEKEEEPFRLISEPAKKKNPQQRLF